VDINQFKEYEMRLLQQRNLLNKCIACYSKISATQKGNYYIVDGIPILIDSIQKLESFPYLNREIQELKGFDSIYYISNDKASIEVSLYNSFSSTANTLINKIQSSISIISTLIEKEKENELSIKLAEYRTLDELIIDLQKIEKIISQSILPLTNSQYIIDGFDVGSKWINIVLSTSLSLSLLAGIVWSGCVIRNKKLEGDILVEKVKSMEVKNESLEDLRNANKIALDLLLKTEAENLYSQIDVKKKNNEDIVRLQYCINEMSILIDKGVEFYPKLDSTEDVKNLFPDYSQLSMIESKIKLIEEK
jgi:hypothetical protein